MARRGSRGPGPSAGRAALRRPALHARRPPGRPARWSVLVSREYAILWAAQVASAIGDSVFTVTLVLWVGDFIGAGCSWAPVAVSGILVASGLGFAATGPLAGVFVDRSDRRAVMIRTEAIRAALAAALAGLSFLPLAALPAWAWLSAVYLTVFCLTAAGQFHNPARLAVTGDIVQGEAGRARAAGLAEAATSAAGILGPPVATPFLFMAGPHWALAANAVSYGVSGLVIRSAARRPAGTGPQVSAAVSVRAGLAAGLRIFRHNEYLAALLSVTMISQAGTSAITALNLFFVTADLHAPPRLSGIAEMAIGGGFVAGALAAGRLVRRAGTRTLIWAGLLAAGTLAAGYALQRSFPGGAALLASYGVMIGMLNTAVVPRLMDAAPPEYLGRVIGVFQPANQLTSALSVVLRGWLASSAMRNVRASVLGADINTPSLLFIVAAGVIMVAGVRALAVLPSTRQPGAHQLSRSSHSFPVHHR